MSARKDLVETYFEGFRHSDHERILACLTDDVAWDLPGYRHLEGKDAFDGEIENEEFTGSPKLTVDRMIEEGEAVVAIGSGEGTHKSATGSPSATSSRSRARGSAASSPTLCR